MSTLNYSIVNNGDSALTILFEEPACEALTRKIMSVVESIKDIFDKNLLDIIPSYQSISVIYQPLSLSKETVQRKLSNILSKPINASRYWSKLIEIPVCYDDIFALDLKAVASHCGISEQRIIEIHSSKPYLVHMLGFLPGFLYLGGLDSQLYCPRKEVPANRVIAGSVGIGGNQTGVYPVDSPGGWNIIGRTPTVLFNPTQDNPVIASPLDQVRFVPISHAEYLTLHTSDEAQSA